MILDLHKNALYRYNSSMQSAKQEIRELKSLLKDPILKAVIDTLQDVIQGLERELIRSIVNRQ